MPSSTPVLTPVESIGSQLLPMPVDQEALEGRNLTDRARSGDSSSVIRKKVRKGRTKSDSATNESLPTEAIITGSERQPESTSVTSLDPATDPTRSESESAPVTEPSHTLSGQSRTSTPVYLSNKQAAAVSTNFLDSISVRSGEMPVETVSRRKKQQSTKDKEGKSTARSTIAESVPKVQAQPVPSPKLLGKIFAQVDLGGLPPISPHDPEALLQFEQALFESTCRHAATLELMRSCRELVVLQRPDLAQAIVCGGMGLITARFSDVIQATNEKSAEIVDVRTQLAEMLREVRGVGVYERLQVRAAVRSLIEWHRDRIVPMAVAHLAVLRREFVEAVTGCMEQYGAVTSVVTDIGKMKAAVDQVWNIDYIAGYPARIDAILDGVRDTVLKIVDSVVTDSGADSIAFTDYLAQLDDVMISHVIEFKEICTGFFDGINPEVIEILQPLHHVSEKRLLKMKSKSGGKQGLDLLRQSIDHIMDKAKARLLRSLSELQAVAEQIFDALKTNAIQRSHLIFILKEFMSVTMMNVLNTIRLETENLLEQKLVSVGYVVPSYTILYAYLLESFLNLRAILSQELKQFQDSVKK